MDEPSSETDFLRRVALWERGLRKLSDPGDALLVEEMIDRLKRRRSQLRLRQEDVAVRLGMPVRSYQKVELGTVPVPPDRLVALAEAIETSPTWLLFGRPAPSPMVRQLLADAARLTEADARVVAQLVHRLTGRTD
jgi:transcriptional regulator with XRE-family HTH domain